MANDYFSVELGDSYIRVADGEVKDQKINLTSLGFIDIPLTFFTVQNQKTIDEAAAALEKLIISLKIQKKLTNIIIPDTYTYSQILPMPHLKEKELLSAIKYQADQFIPLPLEEATLDLDIIYEDKEKKSLLILIVVAAQNLVDLVGRIVERVGLIPQNIENEVSAVSRLINTVYKEQPFKQPTIFINLGYYSTGLYYYDPLLKLISHIHNFKIGLDLFSREAQVNFNLDKQKVTEALKSIGLAQNGSLNLSEVLAPAFNEFSGEVEKFIISIKDKEKISSINQLFVFNLADKINYFDKALEKRLGISSLKLDLSPFLNNVAAAGVYKQSSSSFISVIGGNI